MYLILIILAIFSLCMLIFTLRNGISPMVSNKKALLATHLLLKNHQTICDLGCGFGFSSLYFAKKNPTQSFIGVENSLVCVMIAKLLAFFTPNLHIRYGNFYQMSFENIDLFYLYLCPKSMKKLEAIHPIFKGKTIISNTFAFPSLTPRKTIVLKDWYKSKLYVY